MSSREIEIRDAYSPERRPLREDWIDKGGSKQPPSTWIPKPPPPPAQPPAPQPVQAPTQRTAT
jgi:hypothetical protein